MSGGADKRSLDLTPGPWNEDVTIRTIWIFGNVILVPDLQCVVVVIAPFRLIQPEEVTPVALPDGVRRQLRVAEVYDNAVEDIHFDLPWEDN